MLHLTMLDSWFFRKRAEEAEEKEEQKSRRAEE
jgi:hypothetical protein